MVELLNEWGFALSETLRAQLETGSLAAVAVVFAAGVLTSFTPCVYPMIPVTVTYIGTAAAGQRSRAVRLSLVYVGGMVLVYATLGVVAAQLGKTFGKFTYTNPWIIGPVGLLIVVFGVVMLDLVTIPVPRFFAGVSSEGAKRGGYVGALLMGLAAGFVAAPCTAPVLGLLLLYVSQTGDVLWGGTLLLFFAIGLGMLLLVLGIFSGLLVSMPRAGAWTSWIKRGFGFGMLAVGGYFLFQTVRLIGGS